MRIALLLVGASLAHLTGCAPADESPPAAGGSGSGEPEVLRPSPPEGSRTNPAARAARVVVLGTSLTSGLGLDAPEREAWPEQLRNLADSAGLPARIVNAGVPGETSAGALARIDWVLTGRPDVLVVETGGNDALRGLPLEQLESNLASIVRRAEEISSTTRVVLVQMEAPPNLGPDYADRFRSAFRRVADGAGVPLVPFLLGGVAGLSQMNQPDGIHPTAAGHAIMARNAWPTLEPILLEVLARDPAAR